jgi:peptidoglycan/LPS O-acetylase OafA/YrhL
MVHLELPWQHWSLRWIVRLGDASYSIYLWHLLGFMTSFILSFKIGYHPDWLCEPWRLAAIAGCSLFSIHTWKKIEMPMIRLGNPICGSNNPHDVIADDRRLYIGEWRWCRLGACRSGWSKAGAA